MKIGEIVAACGLEEVLPPSEDTVEAAYCGDLMSDVMGHARHGSLWVTIQAHQNSIGVAQLKDIPAIVFCNGVPVEEAVVAKARREGVGLFKSDRDAFTLCGQLYALGLRGARF